MDTLLFISQNLDVIAERTLQHISIVGVAIGLAILTGFRSGSYFSFCFSDHFKVSPSSLRNAITQGNLDARRD